MTCIAAVVAVTALSLAGAEPAPPAEQNTARARNVIVMVADGAGFNTWTAASMWEGTLGREFYDTDEWTPLAVTVDSLRTGAAAGVGPEFANTQFPNRVYDPVRAWDSMPVPGGQGGLRFEGYRWLRGTAPDSASTASAIASGTRSYDGSINVDGAWQPVERTLARLAHDSGRRVGIVSSVPFTHATPAALGGAHNTSRNNYCEIAVELLTSGLVDVIAGVGHPDFDNNGDEIAEAGRKDYRYIGDSLVWDALTGAEAVAAGATLCGPIEAGPGVPVEDQANPGTPQPGIRLTAVQADRLNGWPLKQTRAEIEALRHGETPDRMLLVPQVGSTGFWPGWSAQPAPYPARIGPTLHKDRGSRANPRFTPPGYDPPNPGVPTLETLTRVALNALDDDEDGFLLHVEGGAVDWAMHDNEAGRMIEELMDFKASIRAVVEWVDAREAWDETLLVVTADHDHMLWGPLADRVAFHPLQDRGAGKMPGYRWLGTAHSNALVRLFARGVGVAGLVEAADRDEPFRGPYLHQADIFEVLAGALEP